MTTNMPPPGRVYYREVDGAMVRSIAVLTPMSTQDDMLDSESRNLVVTYQF
jgi:hypothetical protein